MRLDRQKLSKWKQQFSTEGERERRGKQRERKKREREKKEKWKERKKREREKEKKVKAAAGSAPVINNLFGYTTFLSTLFARRRDRGKRERERKEREKGRKKGKERKQRQRQKERKKERKKDGDSFHSFVGGLLHIGLARPTRPARKASLLHSTHAHSKEGKRDDQ